MIIKQKNIANKKQNVMQTLKPAIFKPTASSTLSLLNSKDKHVTINN